jgi:hypothetical protein
MKTIWGRAALAAAVLAMPATAIAQAAEKPCIEPAEAQALLTFMLPGAFDALSDQCRTALPADAVLSRSGKLLAARYRPEADAAWPMAKQAFGKMSDAAILKLLDDATLKKLVSAGIAGELPKQVKTKDCGTVDRFVAALEPLPARNVAMLLGALIEVGSRADAQGNKASPFKICKPAEAAVATPVTAGNGAK